MIEEEEGGEEHLEASCYGTLCVGLELIDLFLPNYSPQSFSQVSVDYLRRLGG